MHFILDGQNVYQQDDKTLSVVGSMNKTETIRIDNNTVADISYQFDLALGNYVEQSRTNRPDKLIIIPTIEEKLTAVKEENAQLNNQIIDLWEQLLTKGVL